MEALKIKAVDLDPKKPGQHLAILGVKSKTWDYSNWLDMHYGWEVNLIIGLVEGRLQVIWKQEGHSHPITWRSDGQWEHSKYYCVTPAVVEDDWADEESKVIQWGKEKRITARYRWDGKQVRSKVVKRKHVRSRCGASRG